MSTTPISDTALEGALLDVDYLNKDEASCIRITIKGTNGKCYEIFDTKFNPYFYFLPGKTMVEEEIMQVSTSDNGKIIKPIKVVKESKLLLGKKVEAFKVFVKNTTYVPRLSSTLLQYGDCYEYDIPFAKRYTIDKEIVPLVSYKISTSKSNGMLVLNSFESAIEGDAPDLTALCFDIEVYNPFQVPRPEKDPIIMISYFCIKGKETKRGVITYKKIDKPFVEVVKDEKEMIKSFIQKVNGFDADIIAGYNSANFDIPYLIERSKFLKIDFNISRFEGDTKVEKHGLVDRIKIAGRVHVDMYLVVRFIAIVGAAEYILKLNRYTLKSVYEAISGNKKFIIEKADIHKMWDGAKEELETLATYSLNDSEALQKIYESFIQIMFQLSKITYDSLSDVAVSTTGQLVDFIMMHNSVKFAGLIPNKPTEQEIKARNMNPIEGAYVKTPAPGVYSKLALFDFRGLYPSIIISHNIDPSTVSSDAKEYYESPVGTHFDKSRKGIMPMILKQLIDQRAAVKKAYKKNPDDLSLGSRSQALKILSNAFFGYTGYPRSRWYSRECASSITAYGRQYIKETMEYAEKGGYKVVYVDTDSIVLLLENNTKDDAIRFIKEYNLKLPESMELELEDFYTRGVFVGKKTEKETAGAKKKYALISEAGRIKIRGFELVRRDWSKIARDTQRKVLETILNEGSPEKAVEIVKDVIERLKAGSVPLSELIISTQLRKGLDNYDVNSPELAAAKKAVKAGYNREEVEHAVIGYIITKHGSSISEKAELEGFAKDYDPNYYINKQVLPATMKILKELNYKEEDLLGAGSQKKL